MDARTVAVGDVALRVGVTGEGPDVVVLAGGPGCVHYLERDHLAPRGHRHAVRAAAGASDAARLRVPRPHPVADLEAVREAAGAVSRVVLGHSRGADLGVRSRSSTPGRSAPSSGVAGTGPQHDRTWSAAYEAGRHAEPVVEVAWPGGTPRCSSRSPRRPTTRGWRSLADCRVPVHLLAAGGVSGERGSCPVPVDGSGRRRRGGHGFGLSSGGRPCWAGWETSAMLTLDEALGLCSTARAAASELGVVMTFAVVDASGHLVAVQRMDGAGWLCADIAQGKAWTAAAFGTTSAAQKEKMEPLPHFAAAVTTMTHGRFMPQTGAVPVFRGGTLLGALGASGATGAQDEEVCLTAVTASGFQLGR